MADEQNHEGEDTPNRSDDAAAKKSTNQAGAKKASAKGSAKKTTKKSGAKKATSKKATSKKAGTKKAGTKKAGTKKAGAKKATKSGTKKTQAAPSRGDAGVSPAPRESLPKPKDAARPWLEAYPRNVPATYAYPAVPVTRLLDDAVADFPEHEAVQFLGASTTYRQLLDYVDRFANALSELGVGRGDRVAVVLPNCPQHVVVVCATLRLGAIAVESDPQDVDAERCRQLNEAGCKVLVCFDPVYQERTGIREALPTVRHVVLTGLQDALPFPKNLLFPLTGRRDGRYAKISAGEGVLRLTELVARTVPAPSPVEVEPASDVAVVVFTRGSTGSPKAVGLTHTNLVANAFQARLWIPDMQAGGENVLAGVPLAHAYGLTMGLGLALLNASTLTLLPHFDVPTTLQTIHRRKPTVFVGTPSMYRAMHDADRIHKYDLSSLRVCVAGGAPLAPAVARSFERLSGGKVREGYGLTEAGPVTHANPIYGQWKQGTIGLPVSDTACVLADLDDPSRPAPEGGPGELAVAGPQVMVGHANRSEELRDAFVDGWLLTGDVAVVDEEGYFSVLERKADLIEVGGHRVFPREVEQVLAGHSAVRQAVVAGVADAAGGQRIKAYVALASGHDVSDDALLTYLGERLASYKLPHHIELREDLPDRPVSSRLRRRLVGEDSSRGAL